LAAKHFAVGERVTPRSSSVFARAGRTGTIKRVFVFVPDLYDVQFDDLSGQRMLYGHELERADIRSWPALQA
jgi:hypothetical protein